MTPVSRGTPEGRVYPELKANAESSASDELIQLCALEGLLARLTASGYADKLVREGGVLLVDSGWQVSVPL